MKLNNWVFWVFLSLITSGCATLKAPEITNRGDLGQYSFVVLPKTSSLSSGSGRVYGNQYGVYGGSSSKQVNPSHVIEGILLKRGLVSTDAVNPGQESKTLLVKYGESGRRDVAGGLGGYTLEVTVTIVTAKTNEVVYSCVAEGQGSTEVDDIRIAIHRCLSGI
jgi:hypothetical protein